VKILIVEDNIDRQNTFQEILKGHELTITASSKEAVKLINASEYAVIFLDHDLGVDPKTGKQTAHVFLASGKGTGFEVAEQIPKSINKNALIIIHSWNPSGAKRMAEAIKPNYKFHSNGVPHIAPFLMPRFNHVIKQLQEKK
jgi:CheY-like chemotaxis protein